MDLCQANDCLALHFSGKIGRQLRLNPREQINRGLSQPVTPYTRNAHQGPVRKELPPSLRVEPHDETLGHTAPVAEGRSEFSDGF